MWDNEHLNRLLEMSKKQSEKMNTDIQVFNEMFAGVVANVPNDQKGKLQKIQSSINKATELAKQGKTLEAQEIINNLQNER